MPKTRERDWKRAKKDIVWRMAGIERALVLSRTQRKAARRVQRTKLCVNSDLVAYFNAASLMKDSGSSAPEFNSKTRIVARPPMRIEWRLMPACQPCLNSVSAISCSCSLGFERLAFLTFSNMFSRGGFMSRLLVLTGSIGVIICVEACTVSRGLLISEFAGEVISTTAST